MKKILIVLLAVAMPFAVQAQPMPEPELTEIRNGIYMLKIAGGNIGISVGDDGVFLIDDQFAPLTPKILEIIAGLTDKPVKFVINTHWHGDHTGGNENLGEAGAIIVAHDNVYQRMSTEQFRRATEIGIGGASTPVAPDAALPVVTFSDGVTFHMNGHTIWAMHVPHSHTDGDSIIIFDEANVVHMGDVFFQAGYPFLDVETGASINGLIKTLDGVLEMIDDDTVVIPGHGVVSDKAGLQEFRDVMAEVRGAVVKGIDAGKSLEQIQAEKPLEKHKARWGSYFITNDKILQLVYLSLTDERFDYD